MDIIDVILAKKLTPQGQIETYAEKSEQAVAQANQSIAAIQAAQDEIEQTQSDADDLLASAREALETAQAAQVELPTAYNTTGQHTDGYMTQKAVTDALDTKATIIYVDNSLSNKVDNTALNNYATKTYVSEQIAAIPTSTMPSGVSNLGVDNAGKIVIIDENGNISAGSLTEEDIASAIANSGGASNKKSLGLLIDYDNKSFERVFDAANLVAGVDFNQYAMYGGRMRCNIADDGTINAFYGDTGYKEDGSNGQVMIYQPKFYYQRIIVGEIADAQGRVISKEQLLLSPTAYVGFKLHPLFINNGQELDYVLLPAYEGNIYDTSASAYILDNGSDIDINADKLSSIAGTKPFVASNKSLTFDNLRQLATNRGTGWRLTNIESESALQMLFMVEFASMNGQYNLGKGVVNTGSLGDMITGSTANLGNGSGRASSTTFINQNTTTQQTAEDATAINYRGMENPWGDYWRAIDGILVKGDGKSYGGVPYYAGTESLEFSLPNMSYGWISNMGIGSATYDWVYMPIKCDNKGNSALPVGDSTWTSSNLNGTNLVFIGGGNTATDSAGLFDYSCDGTSSSTLGRINGRIMFVPTKNAIYTANIAKWQQHYGG